MLAREARPDANLDLREWLRLVDDIQQLRLIEGADPDLEIGALTEMFCLQSKSRPCLLFDQIKGYPAGWRVASNSIGSLERTALTLNVPLQKSHTELVKVWRERSKDRPLVPANAVSDGAVMENVVHGPNIDVNQFPAPLWHEDDGGRYLGTGNLVITRDPETGQLNMGTYRMMVQDRDKVGLYIGPGQHGRLHRDKYFARGEPMPVVAVFGAHPLLFAGASLPLPLGMNELEWVGGVYGQPADVIAGPLTGLPIPANVEIAVEGYVDPQATIPEGPFGEYTGYYAAPVHDETYIQIEALYYRDNPIILGSQTMRPPGEYYHLNNTIRQGVIWDAMDAANVPDVQAISHLPGSLLGVLVISIKQRYSGHAKQAGMVAAHTRAAGQFGRYVVVVDDDIDVDNTDEVLWALWTRSDPAESADLVRNCWSQPLDPRLPPDKRAVRDYTHSRMVIDATRPFHWRDQFPKVVGTSEELQEKMRAKWSEDFFR